MTKTRLERDPLGEKPVPADALYGIQTLRAAENFPISGLRPLPAFVDAVVWIKRSPAPTHRATGRPHAPTAPASGRPPPRRGCSRAATGSIPRRPLTGPGPAPAIT